MNRSKIRNFWQLAIFISVVGRLLSSHAIADEGTPPVMKAGAAEVKITTSKDPQAIHDDLYARVLVLGDGTSRLAIVTLDLGGMSPERALLVRQAIEKETGVPEANVVINCSHTHNSPGPREKIWEDGLSYDDWLRREIVGIVAKAIKELRPATIRFGREPVQIGFNRRVPLATGKITMAPNPHGTTVPWVDVLAVYGADGQSDRIGILFSHAAHPVIIHESSDLIGADFPGAAVKTLQDWLWHDGKPNGVIMFAQGCGGNINGYPLRGGYQACEVAGRTLAQAIVRAKYDNVAPGKLQSRSLKLSLPFQDAPSVDECEKLVARYPDDKRYARLLEVAKSGEAKFMPFAMRTMAIGEDVCIVSLPNEMFAEYQLFAVSTSPFKHTFVFGYTNGTGAYVATRKDYLMGELGGYESSPYGNALGGMYGLALKPEVEKMIQQGITTLFEQLTAE